MLRPAAALALSWYLMLPPSLPADQVGVDLSAPLSEWRAYSQFGSAWECAQGQIEYSALTQGERRHKLLHQQFVAAVCIADTIRSRKPLR
jgi:hypothetical protein